jgi:hypothetical protein
MGIVETRKYHKNEPLICGSTPFEYDKKPNGFDILCIVTKCFGKRKPNGTCGTILCPS